MKSWLNFLTAALFICSATLGAEIPALLLTAPVFPDSAVSPYTNEVTEDLIGGFAEERRLLNKSFAKKKLDKLGRQKKLHDAYQLKNDAVKTKVVQTDFKGAATPELVQAVYQKLVTLPVAKVEEVYKYDKRGGLGFCFGRAMLVHQLLRKEKIAQNEIAKIFVVGKLTYQDLLWDFHVGTMVRTTGNEWVVIDSLYEKPLPVLVWMERARSLGANQANPEFRFYVTDPRKFHAAYGVYQMSYLHTPDLRDYFTRLLASF